MNKLLIIAISMVLTTTAQAQFKKGDRILEGDFGAQVDFKNKNDGPDAKTPYSVNLGLSLGFFTSAKNEVGFRANFGRLQSYNFFDLNDINGNPIYYVNLVKSNSFGGQIFYRRYKSLTEKLSFASGIGLSYTYRSFKTTLNGGQENEGNSSVIEFGYTPSLLYRLNDRLGIRGSFGFAGVSFLGSDSSDVWDSNLTLSFSPNNLNFGIFLILNGTKSND